MNTPIVTALVAIVVAVITAIQTVVLEAIKRKAAPIAREAQANLTVQKLSNSGSSYRAVSDEAMDDPTSPSGIFWHNRAVEQEKLLAAIRRVIYSSQYDAGPKACKAIELLIVPQPGESSNISITIPGKDKGKGQ